MVPISLLICKHVHCCFTRAVCVQLCAGDVMKAPVKILQLRPTVGTVKQMLSSNKHNGFPVVDNEVNTSDARLLGLAWPWLGLLPRPSFRPLSTPCLSNLVCVY